MRQSFKERLKLKIRDARMWICKKIIQKATRKLDILHHEGFMEYSFNYDSEITYHVIKERNTEEFRQYGTAVTWWKDEE